MLRTTAPTFSGWTLRNHVRLSLDLMGLTLSLSALATMLWWQQLHPRLPSALIVLPVTQSMLFTVSAIYHGVDWSPRAKARWQRADHAMIYFKVAGTATALALLVDAGPWSDLVIAGVWCVTIPGVAQKIWWPDVPVTWSMPVQFGQALMTVPVLHAFADQFPGAPVRLLAAGLIFYLVGFAIFVWERPRFWPGQFCHHDFFHVMLICAALSLYAALAHGVRLA